MKTSSQNIITGNLIAASAGTGKTYQLTSRYLALLALGARPEKMIALTFTKKAAGEFRNRIFQALADAALDKPDRDFPGRNAAAVRIWETWTGLRLCADWSLCPAANTVALFPAAIPMLKRAAAENCYPELLEPVKGEPPLPRLTAEFFSELLIRVLNKAGELQLSTLDSFFNRVVAADMRRAGLSSISPMNALQQQRATQTALLAMLAESEKSSHHESALITLLTDISDDKGGAILELLEKNINTYLNLYKEFTNGSAWGDTAPFQLPDCRETPLLTDDEVADIQTEIDTIVARLSWKKPRSFVKKSLPGIATKIKNGKLKPSESLTGWLDGAEKFLPPVEEEGLDEQLRDILQKHIRHCACIFLRSVQERSSAMFELLQKYYTAYRDCVLSAGMCTFDDIKQGARKLLSSNTPGEESGIALKLTTRLDHWMLDEFQDTDPVQWEILSPLLKENAQDTQKTLFVVGDKKQSIYSFRGASASLFEQLRGTQASEDGYDWQRQLVNSSLSESRRSAPAIMDFTNLVFASMDEVAPEFSAHSTHKDNTAKKGYVRVCALREKLSAQVLQAACEAIGDILEELTEPLEHGQRRLRNGISVAILLRTSAPAKSIVAWLRRYKPGIPVQLVEDTPLVEASPLGELLLSFFLWLRNPADEYRYNVLRVSPLGAIMRGTKPEVQHSSQDSAWDKWIHTLNEQGYAAVIQELATYLPELTSTRMLKEWLEEAVSFDAAGGTLDEWLLHMRSCSRKENGSSRFVQVMTMHKSKGAEFDAVILPFLGSKAADQPRAEGIPYFLSEDKEGILVHPGNAEERRQWEPLLDCEAEWKRARRDDSYNLMYVALTRARLANYLLLPGEGEPVETPNKEADWILQSLYANDYQLTPEQPVEFGAADWYEECSRKNAPAPAPAPLQPLGRVCPARARRTPSSADTEAVTPTTDRQQPGPVGGGADFGTEVHEAFEQITWCSEAPKWLKAPRTEAQKVVAAALQQPEVCALFTPAPGQEVYTEQSVEAINEANEWISASIDRLLLTCGADGRPTAAHIIDFKTNHPVPKKGYASFYDWLRAYYIPQMAQYRDLIEKAFGGGLDITVSLISCPREYQKHPARVITYTAGELKRQK